MTSTREMSRIGSSGGKKKIILGRTPRRRRRDDIPLVRLPSDGSFSTKSCFSSLFFLLLYFLTLFSFVFEHVFWKIPLHEFDFRFH